MRATIAFFALLGFMYQANADENYLLGLWKSDRNQTVASMKATNGIPEEDRKIFEDNFFGLLLVEYTNNGFVAWFEDEEKPSEYTPYRVLEETGNHLIVQSFEEDVEARVTKRLEKSNDCYFLLVSKFSFKEYFCRVK